MKKEIKKKVVKKEEKVELFTDEMAKSMYLFQDKLTYTSRTITNTFSLSKRKK